MAAVYGTREQCRRVLSMPYSKHDINVALMRGLLSDHLKELNEVAEAVNFGKAKSRKYENMELTT